MENSTSFDKESVFQAIQEGYGIEVTNFEFMLRGFGGDCYQAVTSAGINYFIKIHDPVANQMTAASSRDFYLPLMHKLYHQDILVNIPHPMQTLDGGFSLQIGPNRLVITNLIEGKLVGFGELPEGILTRLAEMIGILHQSRAELVFEHPFIEKYEIMFEYDLLESFESLSRLPEKATPGQKTLREIILPRKTQLITDLDELKKLQSYAINAQKPKVICHTDLHGGNLIMDRNGSLYILDWENAMIAPPEHDLFFFAGQKSFWESFWPHYIEYFPSASVDPNLFRFYFYRRALEDVADFIFRILRREDTPDQDQKDIGWMVDCLDGMAQIEPTVELIKERISLDRSWRVS